jgi:hypothetical protein
MRKSWIWTGCFRLSEARDKPSKTRAASNVAAVQLNTKGQTHKICSSYVDARIAPKKSRVWLPNLSSSCAISSICRLSSLYIWYTCMPRCFFQVYAILPLPSMCNANTSGHVANLPRGRSCHSLPVHLRFPRASHATSNRSCRSLCDAEAFQCCHSGVHICGRHATEIEFNTDCMQQECAFLKFCSWRTICNFSSRSGSQKTAHRKRWDYLKQ